MTNTIPKYASIEVVHTMSELIPGFKTYQDFCGKKKFTPADPNPNQQIKSVDEKEVLSERGLGQILAVAVLINDVDVIGGSGGNIGFQVIEDAVANMQKLSRSIQEKLFIQEITLLLRKRE